MKDIFLLVTAYLTVYQQLMCTNGSCKSPHLQRNTQPQTCVLSRVPTPAATARIFLSPDWSRGEGGGGKSVFWTQTYNLCHRYETVFYSRGTHLQVRHRSPLVYPVPISLLHTLFSTMYHVPLSIPFRTLGIIRFCFSLALKTIRGSPVDRRPSPC